MLDKSKIILGSGLSFSKENDIAEKIIRKSLETGIISFDTAPSYRTEALLGGILKKQLAVTGYSRKQINIQTKIDARQMQENAGKNIRKHVENALRNLQTDYLDSLLVHWPVPEYMDETWKQLQKLKTEGVVKRIGICNVRMRQLKKYLEWSPDIIQIERHPLNTFREEVDFCCLHGIEVQAYSPLCKMDSRIKNNPKIKDMALKYGKDEGQIVLRWHLDTGVIPIFTTTKEKRVVNYSKLSDFSLSPDEIESIYELNENYKLYLESFACPGF